MLPSARVANIGAANGSPRAFTCESGSVRKSLKPVSITASISSFPAGPEMRIRIAASRRGVTMPLIIDGSSTDRNQFLQRLDIPHGPDRSERLEALFLADRKPRYCRHPERILL